MAKVPLFRFGYDQLKLNITNKLYLCAGGYSSAAVSSRLYSQTFSTYQWKPWTEFCLMTVFCFSIIFLSRIRLFVLINYFKRLKVHFLTLIAHSYLRLCYVFTTQNHLWIPSFRILTNTRVLYLLKIFLNYEISSVW